MPKRKIVKRNISKEQFLTMLDRAIRPVKKPVDSTSTQTSESRPADDYSEKRTRSNRTVNI